MKLLLIAADGHDGELPALSRMLDEIGIPYDTLVARETPLTEPFLWDGVDHGYYQGIVLCSGSLAYVDPATGEEQRAFTDAQWQTLWQYEAAFGIRQIAASTNPQASPATDGLHFEGTQDSAAVPLQLQLTQAGQEVFPYIQTTATITATVPPNPVGPNRVTYLATVSATTTTPLLVTPQQFAVVSVSRQTDGRENLILTTPNHRDILHSMLLSYGLVDWVTRGVFLGARQANLGLQVDDLFAQSAIWDPAGLSFSTGLTYRMTGDDFRAAAAWQKQVHATFPTATALTLELAFNGRGATGIFANDSLVPAVRDGESQFNWVNHSFSHQNLNAISTEQSLAEIKRNDDFAREQLGLTHYTSDTMVQPDVSGLNNPEFLSAARDFGIRYLISDTSQAGWDNPSFNEGIQSGLEPAILIVPRRPTGLYAYTSRPEELVSEYNSVYGVHGSAPFWGRDLDYREILDKESDLTLRYLLKGDVDLLMFHQTNLRAYDGVHSVLGDLVDATLAKYSAVSRLPIRNLTQREVGKTMERRMNYNASGAQATLLPGRNVTLTVATPAVVPLTGISFGSDQEVYGGKTVSYVTVNAAESLVIPVGR